LAIIPDCVCDLVHLRDGYKKILAFLECYLDESGTHGSAELCTVAGYVGGRGQLKKFEDLWNKALEDFDVSYFRATKFWG